MNKFKTILLLIVLVVLADFAWENKALPPPGSPELKLFTFTLGQIPPFLLAYISLVLGLIGGWIAHVLRIRKKKRQAAALLTKEKQAQGEQGQEAST